MLVSRTALAFLLAWSAATSPSPCAEPSSTQPSSGHGYRCGPGDRLEVTVFEVDELSRSVVVGGAGEIRMPLLGPAVVAGLTTAEIATKLERLYAADLLVDPQILVAVEEVRSRPVSVLGAVREPGVYQLEGRRRLHEVIAMAGGFSDEVGSEVIVRPARPSAAAGSPRAERRFKVRDLLGPEPTADTWVEPFDAVHVEEAGLVYVLGAVGRPGGFPIRKQQPPTALEVLSLAQGAKPSAALKRARILRRRGAGRVEIDPRLAAVLAGEAADPLLQADDILFLPDSKSRSALNRGAEAILQMATGIVIWRR